MKTLNIKLKLKFLFVALAAVAMLQSCKRDGLMNTNDGPGGNNQPITNIEQMVVPPNFDYATTREVMVDVVLADAMGAPFKGTKVTLYDGIKEPGTNPRELFTGYTGADGKLLAPVSIPTYLKEVVVFPYCIGIPNNITVAVAANKVAFRYANGKIQSKIEPVKISQAQSLGGFSRKAGVQDKISKKLGTWNNDGVPNYLESSNDNLSSTFLTNVNASLPESRPVPQYHPEYLLDGNPRNLRITELADVFITFVHEGAGYLNSLMYYVYHKDSVPTNPNGIDSFYAVFPNCSFSGSGGGLSAGNKVKIGRFKKDYVIGFACAADGYDNGNDVITNGRNVWYTNKDWNNEAAAYKQHTATLYDSDTKRFLIGFEDLKRDNSSSDEDFNDVVFFATSNPVTAIDTTNVPPIDEPGDCDNDGVSDVYDDYPCDASKAYDRYYPSATDYGTLAFEDLWPNTGDYDMNDLVLRWRFKAVVNAQNKVVQLDCKAFAAAKGATFPTGFGIQFPFNASVVSSATGSQITRNRVTLASNGLEAGHTKAVLILFDESADQLSQTGTSFYNTINYSPVSTPDTMRTQMVFTTPLNLADMGTYPFNPFIFTTNRNIEVHLPGMPNTALANTSLFGTGKDNSNIDQNRYYKTRNNLPWALHLPNSFAYPSEKTQIIQAYLNFANWAQSGGESNTDWYLPNTGNIDDSKLFLR